MSTHIPISEARPELNRPCEVVSATYGTFIAFMGTIGGNYAAWAVHHGTRKHVYTNSETRTILPNDRWRYIANRPLSADDMPAWGTGNRTPPTESDRYFEERKHHHQDLQLEQ